MHFDRRFGMAISMSVIWGAIVALGFYALAAHSRGKERGAALKQVVVAARLLPEGSAIDRAAVALNGVPEAMLPVGAFTRLEDVIDRPVVHEIQAGEPVLEARVAAKGSGVGLGPLIPPGMRAISVRANDVVGVAGYVLPGMRVDVLVTGKPSSSADSETRTVLQNIKVLSAGQTIQNDVKSQPIVAPVVTLLVTPLEAEALTLSNSEGHIQLVLRNSTDGEILTTPGRGLHDLYGAPATGADRAERQVVVQYGDKPAAEQTRAAAGAPTASATTASAPPPSAPPVHAAAPTIPALPEQNRMIIFQGAVKKVEVFPPEPKSK